MTFSVTGRVTGSVGVEVEGKRSVGLAVESPNHYQVVARVGRDGQERKVLVSIRSGITISGIVGINRVRDWKAEVNAQAKVVMDVVATNGISGRVAICDHNPGLV